jgi:flagellar hook assembly protein FlgD
LTLTLTAPAGVHLMVRGLGGRLVKELSSEAGTGTTTLTWDGTDTSGRKVPAGAYVVEATAVAANGAVSRATRTVVVR